MQDQAYIRVLKGLIFHPSQGARSKSGAEDFDISVAKIIT